MFRRKPDPRPLPPPGQPREVSQAQPPTLSRAQITRIDWEGEAANRPQPPAVRPSSYVPAPRTIDMPTVHLASPDTHVDANIVPAATVEAQIIGSHQDRAEAWLRYSIPLSVSMALLSTIAAVALYDVPLLSWAALMTFGLAFVATYAGLLLRYWAHSPEGVALTHTRGLWRYLRTEQKHRHTLERQAWDRQRKLEDRNVR
jgi:hypothetical protein